MDSDLSHEAVKRFDEAFGHIGQLYERVRRLESNAGIVPEEDEAPTEEEQEEI